MYFVLKKMDEKGMMRCNFCSSPGSIRNLTKSVEFIIIQKKPDFYKLNYTSEVKNNYDIWR